MSINKNLDKPFTLYTNHTVCDYYNTIYPEKLEIKTVTDLAKAAQYDHVPSAFKDNKRNNTNFLSSNVIIMDVDNASEDSGTWVTTDSIKKCFPDTEMIFIPSKSFNISKAGKKPREKFHVYFPLSRTITDREEYSALQTKIINLCPAFDKALKDAGRFIAGNKNSKYKGIGKYITGNYVDLEIQNRNVEIQNDEKVPEPKIEKRTIVSTSSTYYKDELIPLGERHNFLCRNALRLIVHYGDTDMAWNLFQSCIDKCTNAAEYRTSRGEEEIMKIWSGAVDKYNHDIKSHNTYLSPEEFALYRLLRRKKLINLVKI